jgi:hypothetical protein
MFDVNFHTLHECATPAQPIQPPKYPTMQEIFEAALKAKEGEIIFSDYNFLAKTEVITECKNIGLTVQAYSRMCGWAQNDPIYGLKILKKQDKGKIL